MTVPISKFMRIRITPRNRSLYGFVGELYVLALSHWRVSGVDGRNRLELHFLESALSENSDWISCSGCENSRSSGEKPNFDPKPQKTRNDSSYQSPHRCSGVKVLCAPKGEGLPELLHCRLVPAALPAPEGRCPCRLRTAPRPSSHR